MDSTAHRLLSSIKQVLSPHSRSDLREASCWIESFRQTDHAEQVMTSLLSEPLGDGEVVLLTQTLRWKLTHMSEKFLTNVSMIDLIQFASLPHIPRGASCNLFLAVAVMIVRISKTTSCASLTSTSITSFFQSYEEILSNKSVVCIVMNIPEAAMNKVIYRGQPEDSMNQMMTTCCGLLNEMPVVLNCFDVLLTEVLTSLDMDELSFPSHPNRSSCFQDNNIYKTLLDCLQGTLNWLTFYNNMVDKYGAISEISEYLKTTVANDEVCLQSKMSIFSLSIVRELLTPSGDDMTVIVEHDVHNLYKLAAEVTISQLTCQSCC